MANIHTLKESRFLRKEDFPQPALLTIKSSEMINAAPDGKPEERKLALSFVELEKAMLCNWTNIQLIAQMTGEEDTDDWEGHKVVIFNNPNISYQGKLTGGISVRAPRAATTAVPVAKPARMPAEKVAELPPDDDVPF